MDAGSEQGLVCVYVTNAGHHMAVHEKRLYCLFAACCPSHEVGCGAGAGQGFRSGCGKETVLLCPAIFGREQSYGSKSPGIVVAEFCVVIQPPADMIMGLLRRSWREDTQVPGHSQVNDETGALVHLQDQVFGPSCEAHDLSVAEFVFQLLALYLRTELFTGTAYVEDGPVKEMGL